MGSGVVLFTCINIIGSFFFAGLIIINLIFSDYLFQLILGNWIKVGLLLSEWGIWLDALSASMLLVVTFISMLVHVYSSEYMQSDPHLPRFMSYLSVFTYFMLMLITSNNFFQLFFGWEGVGLASYLLINFWYSRVQANKSAIKALILNRVGDFCLMIAMVATYYCFDTLDFVVVFICGSFFSRVYAYIENTLNVEILELVCILIFFAAMGKSAQLGLHTWLPDAMEGPTPVSALIHAATMVTAGVFLLIRCSYLFELTSLALTFICFIGSLTTIFGSSVGLFQNDLKKIIAFSTCSQLGYMVYACGLSIYDVAIFHLINHAIFKALLFLGAGSIIHAVSDEQDIRKLGALYNLLPYSYSFTLIGCAALSGIPFFTGFYSKDTLIEVAFATQTIMGSVCYWLGVFAAFCTAFYSSRLLYLVFLSNSNSLKGVSLRAYEGDWRLTLPLSLLACLSLVFGYITNDLFIGFGTSFWSSAIFISPKNYTIIDIEFIFIGYKLVILIYAIIGVCVAVELYRSYVSLFF